MKSNRLINRENLFDLDLKTRIELEMKLTDAESKTYKSHVIPKDWSFDNYRNQSPWRRFLFDFLGPLKDRIILDLGCGYLPTSVYFALAGAKKVFPCDVSPKALEYIISLAKLMNVTDKVVPLLCAGEQLPFPDESIDIVHGEAVLHHLSLSLAGPEIARILKRQGKVGFKDPLGQNFLLELARDYLPYKWKADAKGTDMPLKFKDIEEFGKHFSYFDYRGFGLSSLVATYIWGRGKSKPREIADEFDSHILRLLPFLQRYCRFVVTCAQK